MIWWWSNFGWGVHCFLDAIISHVSTVLVSHYQAKLRINQSFPLTNHCICLIQNNHTWYAIWVTINHTLNWKHLCYIYISFTKILNIPLVLLYPISVSSSSAEVLEGERWQPAWPGRFTWRVLCSVQGRWCIETLGLFWKFIRKNPNLGSWLSISGILSKNMGSNWLIFSWVVKHWTGCAAGPVWTG